MIRIYDIKKGDTVVLRDGNRKLVTENDNGILEIGELPLFQEWFENGKIYEHAETDFDIVAVEQKKIKTAERYIAVAYTNSHKKPATNFLHSLQAAKKLKPDQLFKIIFTEGAKPLLEEIKP